MNLLRFLRKPEYFFRPVQVVSRVGAALRSTAAQRNIKTTWGERITINETETIGRSLAHMGVYDLVLTECLWRLTKDGDTALDIGANIGYFSLLLSHRVGPRGRVHSFEPHPRLFEKLRGNLENHANCSLHNVALSDKKGTLDLFIPKDFSNNEGTATLEPQSLKGGHGSTIPVVVEVLDEVLKSQKVNVIKIDVEGHETSVFSGAVQILKTTDHVLFEDFHGTDSRAIRFLKSQGFEVFRLQKKFWGPKLISVEEGMGIPLWEPPNYLATRKKQQAFEKLAPRGWHCLL